jgi:hypothetical protein
MACAVPAEQEPKGPDRRPSKIFSPVAGSLPEQLKVLTASGNAKESADAGPPMPTRASAANSAQRARFAITPPYKVLFYLVKRDRRTILATPD